MRRTSLIIGTLCATAAVAVAAVSTNFINDPAVRDSGGGIAASTNFANHGSIDGVAFSADIGGGNQAGTGSSTNFINVIGFPDGAAPGTGAGTPPVVVAAGGANPPASNELNTTIAAIPMLQFVVTAGVAGDVLLNAFTFTASGSGDDLNDIASVNLYADTNGNGLVDGIEATVASAQNFSADDGTATFTPSAAIQINAGLSQTFLVVYTYAGSSSATDTFTCTFGPGGLSVTDTVAAPLTPSGLPVTGGTKTMVASGAVGSLSLTVGADNPGGTSISGGPAAQQGWFQFSLRASTVESVTFQQVILTASGSLNDILDITAVRLYIDSGVQPGAVDGSDVALATGTYTGDDGTVTFGSLSQTIAAGNTTHYLVAYDVGVSATPGATAAVTIVNNTDVGAQGQTSTLPIATTGAPAGSVRFIATAGPSTTVTGGSSGGGGGCAMLPAGAPHMPTNSTAPLAVLIPWLGLLTLLWWRRRA